MESYNKTKHSKNKKKSKEEDNKRFTHFLSLPLSDPNFISSYSEIKKSMIEKGYDESLFTKEKKMHLTITVLNLSNPSNLEEVKKILEELKEDIPKIKEKYLISENKMIFSHQQYDHFDGKEDWRVIYSKMVEDENFEMINEIADYIVTKLVEKRIILKEELSKYKISYLKQKYVLNQIHATIIKTGKNKELSVYFTLKDSNIFNDLSQFKLPNCPLDKIALCQLSSKDNEDGTQEYITDYSIDI